MREANVVLWQLAAHLVPALAGRHTLLIGRDVSRADAASIAGVASLTLLGPWLHGGGGRMGSSPSLQAVAVRSLPAALPFRANAFDAVVWIEEERTQLTTQCLQELHRVLSPQGVLWLIWRTLGIEDRVADVNAACLVSAERMFRDAGFAEARLQQFAVTRGADGSNDRQSRPPFEAGQLGSHGSASISGFDWGISPWCAACCAKGLFAETVAASWKAMTERGVGPVHGMESVAVSRDGQISTELLYEAYCKAVGDRSGTVAWAQGLDADLRAARQLVSQLMTEQASAVAWAQGLEDELQQERSNHSELQREFDERGVWAEALHGELHRARSAHAMLQREFDERGSWAMSLEGELARARVRIDDLTAESADLAKRLTQSEQERQAILQSWSWRLTYPLRYIARLLGKI